MFTRSFAVAAFLLLAATGGPLSAGAPATVPADERAVVHALNRLTFGPRPGDVERVRAMGLGAWIEQQLAPARIDDSGLTARLAHLDTLELDSKTIAIEYAGPALRERRDRQLQAGSREPGTGNEMPSSSAGLGSRIPDPGSRQMSDAQRTAREVIADLEQAKLLRAVYSERQLEEVLVDFWFNHFNVFAGKGATRNYVGEYEREAIRPFVFGHFRDMLEATAKSPAMLFYLDNWESATPMTRNQPGPQMTQMTQNRNARRPQGLNENYARELMELHTLGVDGGYTQQDIVEVARSFTGWTIRPRMGSGFLFAAPMHDQGEKKVLGHVIRAGGGMSDGLHVLNILAAHPATAHFIALKLATRFVSDHPQPTLVDRAAARFTATRGDLREVVRTIITSPEFFSTETYRTKVKTPLEFVVSAVRTTGAEVRNALPLARELREQGMPLYFCQPPTGYDDTASSWVSSGALVSRMNFAVMLGENTLPGVRVPGADKQITVTIGSPDFQRR